MTVRRAGATRPLWAGAGRVAGSTLAVTVRGTHETGDTTLPRNPYRRGHLPGDRDSSPSTRPSSGGRPSNTRPKWTTWLLVALGIAAVAFVAWAFSQPTTTNELTYTQFIDRVEAGRVESVVIGADGRVEGEFADGTSFTTVIPTAVDDTDLLPTLRENNVVIDARPPSDGGFWGALLAFLPFLLLIGLFVFFSRRARGRMSQITGIGQSNAKVHEADRPDTRFDDIAGYEGVKEEVREVIDYLKDPLRYQRAGARGPGGVLLVGPPGTGKTLIARAVAGEANVPFISANGSEFVEMLVGVGASRVRDLFEKARERQPAIIFIDELDSVGRKRGSSTTIGANNEQEQTLNQLLAEMDGFDPAEGIVIMAATNRPEMLDPALLRPGRFDRRIQVPLPTMEERLEILEIHCTGKPMDPDLNLIEVARGTPGFSGADLENLTNEAAIHAIRHDQDKITKDNFDQARTRIMLGRREDSSVMRPEELHRVAVHESGHAIVAALSDDADPVDKITILPTRQALGATEQLPLDERRLHSETYLRSTLAIRLGGRAAELVALGEASTGAANDLARATDLAGKMVRDLGLSEEMGPIGYSEEARRQFSQNGQGPGLGGRPYSEATQRAIDKEVARLLREAEERAVELLTTHRDALDALVELLLDEETVDGAKVYELVGVEVPGRHPSKT